MTAMERMSELEGLAQTLCLALNANPTDELISDGQVFTRWEAYVPAVRTVLTAMREPSMDMTLKGAEAVNKQMRGPGAPADYDAAKDAWQAMIDAILKASDDHHHS